jgi:hypothetical protein
VGDACAFFAANLCSYARERCGQRVNDYDACVGAVCDAIRARPIDCQARIDGLFAGTMSCPVF